MDFHDLMHFLLIAFYALGTVCLISGMLSRNNRLKRLAFACAISGFALHTAAVGMTLGLRSMAEYPPGFYFRFAGWTVLAVFFLLMWRRRMDFLGLVASPMALLLYLLSFAAGSGQAAVMPKKLVGLFFGLHIGSLFLSFALMAMASGAGLLFIFLDQKIKSKEKLTNFAKDLPSLSVFDKVNHWSVIAGFPLFTLGMLSGIIWGRLTWGSFLTGDPKEIVSLFIWGVFGFLFHQRLTAGWQGRKPARLATWIFLFTLLSMLVINFFFTTHHSFQA